MSLFKVPVKPEILANELTSLYDSVRIQLNRTTIEASISGIDQEVSQAVQLKIHDLLVFAIDRSLRTNLKPKELEAVRESAFVLVCGDPTPYWASFDRIPQDRSDWGPLRRFGRSEIEYLIVGNTFLEQCGRTGIQEMDDTIRLLGANTFVKVCGAATKEIKRVRLILTGSPTKESTKVAGAYVPAERLKNGKF